MMESSESEKIQIPLTKREQDKLYELETNFQIAKKWGYNPENHEKFELRMHEGILGLQEQAYTDIVFRNLYHIGKKNPLHFSSDIKSKFGEQTELPDPSKKALETLVNEYFDDPKNVTTKIALLNFIDINPENEISDRSATYLGMQYGVSQLIAIGRNDWEKVIELRTKALEIFSSSISSNSTIAREEGSGYFPETGVWISYGDKGVGVSYYPVNNPLEFENTLNYDEDANLIDDDDLWWKIWESWKKTDETPKSSELKPFINYVVNLTTDNLLKILDEKKK